MPMFLSGPRQQLFDTKGGSAPLAESKPLSGRRSAPDPAFAGLDGTARSRRRGSRAVAAVLLCGGLGLTALPAGALADSSSDDLNKLRADIQKEIAALKKQEAKLHQQFLDLDRKSKLLDRKSELLDEQLQNMRATGVPNVAPPGVGAPGSTATISSAPTVGSPAPPAGP
ncbi:MAG: hypothetical protein WA417_08610, partial [Stellaceae bacterium]